MRKNNKGLATLTIVLITVAAIMVVGGTIGGVVAYNSYQEKKQQEADMSSLKSIEDARNNAFNEYNERINQIMSSLNVDKDGVASIDNNEDVEAMTNAVNELNNLANDVNNDTIIAQEQKDTLNGIITGYLETINNRVKVVNEARAEAEKYKNVVSEVYGSGYSSWQNAYADYVQKEVLNKAQHSQTLLNTDFVSFDLVYIDDDNQPELWIQLESEASGERVLTYDSVNNQLKVLQLMRIGSHYIPYSGLICNSCGHMGVYPTYIYQLHNGDFYKIGEGLEEEISPEPPITFRYEWEGASCSHEEYENKIKELYSGEKSVFPEEKYKRNTILEELKNR